MIRLRFTGDLREAVRCEDADLGPSGAGLTGVGAGVLALDQCRGERGWARVLLLGVLGEWPGAAVHQRPHPTVGVPVSGRNKLSVSSCL